MKTLHTLLTAVGFLSITVALVILIKVITIENPELTGTQFTLLYFISIIVMIAGGILIDKNAKFIYKPSYKERINSYLDLVINDLELLNLSENKEALDDAQLGICAAIYRSPLQGNEHSELYKYFQSKKPKYGDEFYPYFINTMYWFEERNLKIRIEFLKSIKIK